MKLVEDGRLDLNKTLSDYLEIPPNSNKRDLVIKDILAHQAGLWPWIPFYLQTLDSNKVRMPEVYKSSRTDDYPIVVCDDLFCSLVYQDSMWHMIDQSQLRTTRDYKYSDLGFYYMKEIIERIYRMPLDQVAREELYEPLGMNRTTYNPLDAGFTKKEIVPTETDVIFRGRTIHGYVHDPGAALMGGVGGHAGVFSNANDIAKYMQMLLNGGEYGGRKYYDSTTIAYFTTAHFKNNRRGLGFDKPDPEHKWGSAADSASLASFGHTGFTGTMAFADPEEDLIFIFLSNRIHPSAENKKLITENSRTKIHQAIYDMLAAKKALKPIP
jgi:CubicO group peptidase (beta-lactamase class C family)